MFPPILPKDLLWGLWTFSLKLAECAAYYLFIFLSKHSHLLALIFRCFKNQWISETLIQIERKTALDWCTSFVHSKHKFEFSLCTSDVHKWTFECYNFPQHMFFAYYNDLNKSSAYFAIIETRISEWMSYEKSAIFSTNLIPQLDKITQPFHTFQQKKPLKKVIATGKKNLSISILPTFGGISANVNNLFLTHSLTHAYRDPYVY